MGECVANFRPRLVQKLSYNLNFLKTKRDEILSNYRQGITYDIMAQLQKLKNEVDMVLRGTKSPTDFNNLNLRNNRDLQAILLLIELGDIDEDNPLDRFGDLGVDLRKKINVWWPFDKPNENADNLKEFLINGEWQLVRFDRQNRSYYYGTLVNGGIEVKVRGQAKVREVAQEQVLTTFERNTNEKRLLKRSLTAAKKEYYRYPVGEQYWNYVITEDEALGARKRGDKISFKDVEDKKVQIDNVAILSVVLEDFETNIYNEDRKDDDGKYLKLDEKQEIKMGDLVYRVLGIIEEIDQEGNKKSFYKVFILPKNKKNMRGYTTRRFFFLDRKDIKKLNAIPEDTNGYFKCKNYKDGKVVGLAEYTIIDFFKYKAFSITLWLAIFFPLDKWLPSLLPLPNLDFAIKRYVQMGFNTYQNSFFAVSVTVAFYSIKKFLSEKYEWPNDFEKKLNAVEWFNAVIGYIKLEKAAKVLVNIIQKCFSRIASWIPMNTYLTQVFAQMFSMIKNILRRSFEPLIFAWADRYFLSRFDNVSNFTDFAFWANSYIVKTFTNLSEVPAIDLYQMGSYLNSLRMFAIIGWFICTAVCYDPCEVLLRNSGQLDKVPYNPKKRTRKEMELLAEQTLRLKF